MVDCGLVLCAMRDRRKNIFSGPLSDVRVSFLESIINGSVRDNLKGKRKDS